VGEESKFLYGGRKRQETGEKKMNPPAEFTSPIIKKGFATGGATGRNNWNPFRELMGKPAA